jgi:hypothetical protein
MNRQKNNVTAVAIFFVSKSAFQFFQLRFVRLTKKTSQKKKKKKMAPRKPDNEAAKENAMLTHLAATAIKGDPASVLDTIDKFCWEGNWMVACDSRDETEMELLGLDGTLAACA